jgi:hypothetical protein
MVLMRSGDRWRIFVMSRRVASEMAMNDTLLKRAISRKRKDLVFSFTQCRQPKKENLNRKQ